MQWLIDICKEWVENWFATYVGFVNRGDNKFFDFSMGDLTTDGQWHDLDLSSIVPEGAKGVCLFVWANAISIEAWTMFRRKGNTFIGNISQIAVPASEVSTYQDLTVPLDINRVIQYRAQDVTWFHLDINVKNWWF